MYSKASERWAMYPMHLVFMYLIHFCCGGMNLLWSIIYGEYSIWVSVITAFFFLLWLLYSTSMKKRWIDFMILSSIYWLGGLAVLLYAYTTGFSTSLTFILMLPSSGILLGFGPLLGGSSEISTLLIGNLLCYTMIMLFTLLVSRPWKHRQFNQST